MAKDADHPWFRPLWARLLVVAICAGFAIWDLINANYGWALIFIGMTGYAIYIFFVAFGKGQVSDTSSDKRDTDDDTQA